MQVTVTIRPKVGLRDPEGNAITEALHALGWKDVRDVHVGKTVIFTLNAENDADARNEVTEMCRKILANPVIEDFDIALQPRPQAAR